MIPQCKSNTITVNKIGPNVDWKPCAALCFIWCVAQNSSVRFMTNVPRAGGTLWQVPRVRYSWRSDVLLYGLSCTYFIWRRYTHWSDQTLSANIVTCVDKAMPYCTLVLPTSAASTSHLKMSLHRAKLAMGLIRGEAEVEEPSLCEKLGFSSSHWIMALSSNMNLKRHLTWP